MGIMDKKIKELFVAKFPEIENELKETINLGMKSAEKRQKDLDAMMYKMREAILNGKEIEDRLNDLIEKKLKKRGI